MSEKMNIAADSNNGGRKTPARVLMAVPQYPYPVVGGLERQSHELAKTLLALGVAVQAVSGKIEPTQPAQDWVEGVLVHRIPWSHMKWLRFIRTPFDLLRVFFAIRNTYDVVHLHQHSSFGLFVILLARLLGKPVLTKLPNVGELGLPGMRATRFGPLKLAIFKRSNAVVAMSSESLAELDVVGFPSGNVLATPNGIRMRGDVVGVNSIRPEKVACRVVFVGRLIAQKMIEDLLHAWQQVSTNTARRVQLELWGSGPLEADLKQLCSALGLAESVVFRGHVDSVRDRLGEMDIFVLPSKAEGNSNAILEAMAAGLPVVSTRVGGTPMLVGAEGARFLIEPGDRAGLISRLLELVEDIGLRQRIGASMRQRVLDHFDIQRVAIAYAAAYDLLKVGEYERIGELANPVITNAVI